MDAETMKYLAIAIISLVMFGAAKGVAEIWSTTISSVSRNPNAKKDVSIFAWAWRVVLTCFETVRTIDNSVTCHSLVKPPLIVPLSR